MKLTLLIHKDALLMESLKFRIAWYDGGGWRGFVWECCIGVRSGIVRDVEDRMWDGRWNSER